MQGTLGQDLAESSRDMHDYACIMVSLWPEKMSTTILITIFIQTFAKQMQNIYCVGCHAISTESN